MDFSLKNIAGTLCLVGIIILFISRDDIAHINDDPVDIYSESFSSLKSLDEGIEVRSELDFMIGPYATKTVTTKRRFSKTETDYNYYMIPVYIGEETYLISCSFPDKGDSDTTAEAIAKITMEYMYYERDTYGEKTMNFRGKVEKLDDKGYNYMKEWAEGMELFESSEISKYVRPINIKFVNENYNAKTFLFIGVGLIVAGAAGLIFAFVRDKKEKAEEAAFAGISNNTSTVSNDEYAFRLKQLQALGDKTVEIGGDILQVSKLTYVDRKILTGDIAGAKEYMMNTYYATSEEADAIIADWDNITSP